jgi:hypothetical protein
LPDGMLALILPLPAAVGAGGLPLPGVAGVAGCEPIPLMEFGVATPARTDTTGWPAPVVAPGLTAAADAGGDRTPWACAAVGLCVGLLLARIAASAASWHSRVVQGCESGMV